MDIIKFTEYLKEAYLLPILDVVIDNEGNLYNGDKKPLIKGRITKEGSNITEILGSDNKLYPAGIDKNGNLLAINFNAQGNPMTISYTGRKKTLEELEKENNKAIENGIVIPEFIPTAITQWNKNEDYYNNIPLTPTGWVNVKVDMEIVKRVRRYSSGIGDTIVASHDAFNAKLEVFQTMSSLKRSYSEKSKLNRNDIQAEMSVIILLHYINEIKDFFHPSSSGFLFESFLAGLIPDSRIKDDNTSADLISGTGIDKKRYQIKFLDSNTHYVDVVKDLIKDDNGLIYESQYLEYYIIGLKYSDKIEIYIVDGVGLYDNGDSVLTPGAPRKKSKSKNKSPELVANEIWLESDPVRRFNMANIKSNKNIVKHYTIELNDIDGRINNIGTNIKKSMDSLYREISVFQYNIETLITGKKQDGASLKSNTEFDRYYTKSQKNLENIGLKLTDLVSGIKSKKK